MMNNSVHPSEETKDERAAYTTETNHAKERYDEEAESFLNRKNISTITGKRPSYREPLTHIKNKTFFESVFGCCFEDFGTQISLDELIPFHNIKADANDFFDNTCKDHDDILREIWNSLTGATLEEVENDGWKNYGFQNRNPRSDFRGGALLSLKQLRYFVKTNKDRVETMAKDNAEFLFAVSSINVTYFFRNYYHLSDDLVYSKDKKVICSRVALKTFCSGLRTDPNLLNKIHGLLLNDLYNVWNELKKRITGLTLMDFNMAVNIVKERFTRSTKNLMYDDFEALRAHYLRQEIVYPTSKPSFH